MFVVDRVSSVNAIKDGTRLAVRKPDPSGCVFVRVCVVLCAFMFVVRVDRPFAKKPFVVSLVPPEQYIHEDRFISWRVFC